MQSPDEGMTRWMRNYARKNHWRVATWIDLDDLIQDGFMHFYRLRDKYPDVESRRHMMSLFQRTFSNHINDLSKQRTRQAEQVVADLLRADQDEAWFWDQITDREYEFDELHATVVSAPKPVRKVLKLLESDTSLRKLRSVYRIRNGHRETLNERLCRLTGYDPRYINLVLWVRHSLT